jgi:hypothetical protein
MATTSSETVTEMQFYERTMGRLARAIVHASLTKDDPAAWFVVLERAALALVAAIENGDRADIRTVIEAILRSAAASGITSEQMKRPSRQD